MKKAVKSGSYSIITSAIVIAIAVIVVAIFELLPANYTKLDTTNTGMFTLSQQTKDLLAELDKNVDIKLIATPGGEDEYITKLLDCYKSASPKVKVETVDPVMHPTFASQYTSEQITSNSLIILYGDKSRYISWDKIYTRDYTTGAAVFNGEGEITGAISLLSSNSECIVYTLQGHGESMIDPNLQEQIANQGYTLKELNLNTVDRVPEDAAVVLIYSPGNDLTDEEFVKLANYAYNEGDVFLVTDYIKKDFPNFSKYTELFGLKQATGVIFEGNPNYCLSNYRHYLLPQIMEHEITIPLLIGGYDLVMPITQGIMQKATLPEGAQVNEVLSTSDRAYLKTDLDKMQSMEKEDSDKDGPFSIAATAERSGASLVWVTSSYAFNAEYNEMSAGANNNFFINCLSWAADNETGISLLPKRLSGDKLKIPATVSTLLTITFIAVIPLIFVIIGIIVLVRRRRK